MANVGEYPRSVFHEFLNQYDTSDDNLFTNQFPCSYGLDNQLSSMLVIRRESSLRGFIFLFTLPSCNKIKSQRGEGGKKLMTNNNNNNNNNEILLNSSQIEN